MKRPLIASALCAALLTACTSERAEPAPRPAQPTAAVPEITAPAFVQQCRTDLTAVMAHKDAAKAPAMQPVIEQRCACMFEKATREERPRLLESFALARKAITGELKDPESAMGQMELVRAMVEGQQLAQAIGAKCGSAPA